MKYISEYRSRFRILKGGKISLIVSALAGSITILSAAPSGGVVTSGSATINQSGVTTNITQSTNKATINWQNFSVAGNETVNFYQPSVNAIALNRVIGNEKSIIDGALNANGQVWILNSSGVLFGKDAHISTAGLLATTASLSDADFNAGNYKLRGESAASVINFGTIEASDSGYVALLANTVSNEGSIKAIKGVVHLSGANDATINLNGNSLVSLKIDKGVLDALVENKGVVIADGGQIYLTTNAVDELLRGVVNNTGIIEANSIDDVTGKIELFAHGGSGEYDGTLNAKGGFVETSGKVVDIKQTLQLQAKDWLIDPYNITITLGSSCCNSNAGNDPYTTSTITAIGNDSKISAFHLMSVLDSGINVTINTGSSGSQYGDIFVNSAISWNSNSSLTLQAYRNIKINDTITATGNTAKLTLEYGQGSADGMINGTLASYTINAPITLQSGQNFSTKLGSSGSLIDYTVINDATALQNINSGGLSGKWALGSSFSLGSVGSWTPLGNWNTKFSGVFEGLGNTLSDLTIDNTSTNQGLFGVTENAKIRNLNLSNFTIKADGTIGTLVSYLYSNSFVDNVNSTQGVVVGYDTVGGLIGNMWNSEATNLYYGGSVDGRHQVGGLIGTIYQSSITQSFTDANVKGDADVGGLVGYAYIPKNIKDTYTIGSVEGHGNVGGLIGRVNLQFSDTYIQNSYAASLVSGSTDVGGLIGRVSSAAILNSFWDIDSTGQSSAGTDISSGVIGIRSSSGSTAYAQNTYSGFDFTNTWFMADGQTRPFLRNQWSPIISNAYELQLMTMDLGATYKLNNNINLTPYLTNQSSMWQGTGSNINYNFKGNWTPIGTNSNRFSGTLNGTEHIIDGLFINRPSMDSIGLFGYTGNSTIKDIGLTNIDITGRSKVGALVGYNFQGSVTNSYAMGSVNGTDMYVGGLVGSNSGPISNSYATVNTIGLSRVGGLVGANFGSISNSYASGSVEGIGAGGEIGGLVGSNAVAAPIYRSYANGSVIGTANGIGGLVGKNQGNMAWSYWDADLSGRQNGVGAGDSSGVIGVHSSGGAINAFNRTTYGGFDFNTVWVIYDGYTRPLLRSFMIPLSVTAVSGSRTYDGTTDGLGVTYSTGYDSGLLFGMLSTIASSKNTGSQTVTPSGLYSNQQGYLIDYVSGMLTIDRASITLSALDITKTYDGTTAALGTAVVSSGTLHGSDILSGGIFAFTNKNAGAGNKTVTISDVTINDGNNGHNYNVSYINNTNSTINKANATATANNDTVTYNGTTQTQTSASTGFISGDNIIINGLVSGRNADSYTSNLSVSGSDVDNYNITSVTNGSLIITKANATITANSDSKTYNGQSQSVSGFSASGLVNGETVAVLDGVSGATVNGTNAGTYTTNLAGSDENYNLSFVNGTLTINTNSEMVATVNSVTQNNPLVVRPPQKEDAPLPHVKQIGYGINLPDGLENEIYAIADEYKKNKRGN